MGEKREIRHSIDDILDSIAKIIEYSEDLTESDFKVNTEKQDAIIRRIEIIGEAAKNIPDEVRATFLLAKSCRAKGCGNTSLFWGKTRSNLENYQTRLTPS